MRSVPCALAVCLVVTAAAALAQTSVGFQDPDDLDALLDYRLPSWGYRTWDGTFLLDGSGATGTGGDRNRNALDLASTFEFHHESEERVWFLTTGGEVGLAHVRDGDDLATRKDTRKDLDGFLRGRVRSYLGMSDWFAGANGAVTASYEEDHATRRSEYGSMDVTSISRRYRTGAGVSWGYGRQRNVTHLVRARRLSERLVALGRAPLDAGQVIAVAEVLARSGSYRMVFDRGDRRFWRDVFEPVLTAGGDPLSPYEIHYLEEVLDESVGPRHEGWYAEVGAGWQEARSSHDSWTVSREWNARLDLRWSHNLSLRRQLRLDSYAIYERSDNCGSEYDRCVASIRFAYLDNLTDRNRLDVALDLHGLYGERMDDARIRRNAEATLTIEDRVYVEDDLVLRPFADLSWHGNNATPGDLETSTLFWSYGVSFHYYFDRWLM